MEDQAEAYSYEKDFEIDWYVSNCTNILEGTGQGGRLKFSLDCLHDIFKHGKLFVKLSWDLLILKNASYVYTEMPSLCAMD